MLLEFKVSNYRSIAEEQVLSFVPAPRQTDRPDNILESGKYQALNAIAVYGSNSSGKSNALLAISLLDRLVHLSSQTASTTKLPYEPFELREGWENKPTRFEITFVQQGHRYRYSVAFRATEVVEESLFRKKEGREVNLFARENDTIEVGSGYVGSKRLINAAVEATRPNALFLSMCDTLNVEEAKSIMLWFSRLNMLDGLNTQDQEMQTVSLWEDEEMRAKIKLYMAALNLNIIDIQVETKEFDESQLPSGMPESTRAQIASSLRGKHTYSVMTTHRVYDKDGKPTDRTRTWKLDDKESSGTQKALHLSGPVLWALSNGGVLIIDEIEAKLHPLMTLNTIETFLNKKSNPNGAQLVFATHDTNLLTYADLRRDQITFAEKNAWEGTELYALSDFEYLTKNGNSSKERPDADKEKRYFEGRYGAIPAFKNFHEFIRNAKWQKQEA
ncbi:AAA family ATPase [Hymenobacter terricola]|uniref:AAA family ATPase n=1 Tax=Hymenobacter terricola TaxID=2819236 RepID=UPI001B30F0A1|nr:ATP-binding protein [Hymenobacter terricola]